MKRDYATPVLSLAIFAAACGMMIDTNNAAQANTVAAYDLPDADTVLAAGVKAVGGQKAVDNIKTLHVKSTMSMMGMQINMDQAWSRDGGRLITTKMPMGESTMGTDGTTAWMKTPMGYALVSEEQAKQMESQTGMFMFMLDPKNFAKDDLKSLEVVGEEEFDGKNCYKLHYIGDDDDKEGFVFFDKDSGLPVGSTQQDGGEDGDKSRMLLKDWKEIEGVKFFHVVSMEITPGKNSPMSGPGGQPSKMEGEIRVDELSVNTLDADHFALPEEVKQKAANQPKPGEPVAEIKLEDLSEEQQMEAEKMLNGIRQTQGTGMIKQVLSSMEAGLPHMPPDRQKMMQYLVQEMKKEIASRGG